MGLKRQKQAKKTISFYKYNFSFREPFQILIDGTFCQAALKNKIQIKEQMPKYLMGEVQLCTTNCALKELETLGKELYGAKIILQRFQSRRCPHLKEPVPASECLLSMLGDTNPHHYFVATQDHALTAGLKKIPGVPLLYIVLNTMVLDKPCQTSLDHVKAVQLGELVSTAQQQSIRSLKEEQGIDQKDGERKGKKRKRKQSHPNPLSCLKKKKKGGPTPPKKKTEEGEKRKRSRNKKQRTEGGDVSAPAVTNT
ncbi:rRNA-processing protein UTP23 homolog [Sebastes umbrosus]|uniref:rRNA-processing protein UTP23 homolog n=1 Tax=Sebastes umbrosus TaxID=72105 RepID=UPI0018A0747E|nr:rRNA-processing protein UTP23 homolog [Sebastes umbrosus]XP_037650004.1 rRNA-processing protein UTP23 homolog [Sebastes umbrosus]XP_037650005.1 rRNA-processing protein UTP23 homolog [Sebastes umbrosus]